MSTTVVEYFGSSDGHRCGYCKTSTNNFSHGMWAHLMSVRDYEDLINRGWRRSGQHCYKPTMKITCCPLYTIKCDAMNFKLNKSHKKILKRLNKFLRDGRREVTSDGEGDCDGGGIGAAGNECFQELEKKPANLDYLEEISSNEVNDAKKAQAGSSIQEVKMKEVVKHEVKQSNGMDESKGPCKKAKQLRLERKMQKLNQKGEPMEIKSLHQKKNQEKSLEDFLNEAPQDGVHKLTFKLIPASKGVTEEVVELYRKYQVNVHNDPPSKISDKSFSRFLCESPMQFKLIAVDSDDFIFTLEEEFNLYKKYQTIIHNDPPAFIGEFREFLVNSMMKITQEPGGPECGYGSFHQQYRLDNKLIAVAVIDILPSCVSSVYFFYDPDYSFLSLGTFGSLKEIALIRELNKKTAEIKNYYMGFYIHSCPKMRYKGRLNPSYLLCPEAYTWHLLDDSIRNRLDASKYQRLNEDATAKDPDALQNEDIFHVKVLYRRKAMLYGRYLESSECDDMQEVFEYAELVGKTCSHRMLLYRE